jgi:hypothetical protein
MRKGIVGLSKTGDWPYLHSPLFALCLLLGLNNRFSRSAICLFRRFNSRSIRVSSCFACRFFRWLFPCLLLTSASTSRLRSRSQGFPYSEPSRCRSLSARIARMISSWVNPNSSLAVLSLRVAPLRCHSESMSVIDLPLLSLTFCHPKFTMPGPSDSLMSVAGSQGYPVSRRGR